MPGCAFGAAPNTLNSFGGGVAGTTGVTPNSTTGTASRGTGSGFGAAVPTCLAAASTPSMGPSVPLPSTRAGERLTSDTPSTNGGGTGGGLTSLLMRKSTQPSTEKKKKSTSPHTSPWTL